MGISYREGPAIPRLRGMIKAFELTEAEKAGPVLAVLAEPHVKQVARAFSSEGATTAQGPWAPLSAKYAAWKRKHVGALGILVFTGLYRRAATTLGLIIREYTRPNKFSLGFVDEKAGWHENGTRLMPKRTVLDKSPADLEELRVSFAKFWIARAKAIIRNMGNAGTTPAPTTRS